MKFPSLFSPLMVGPYRRHHRVVMAPLTRTVIARSESDEAIHFVTPWIASRSLSSGAHSRDPLARNDGEHGRGANGKKHRKRLELPTGQCLCGKVGFEIDVPARWAWHDHSAASRRAHGAAYATYVGSWRKRFRVTRGSAEIARYEDKLAKTVRSFCARCGTPLLYERARSPHMVNIPRALFSGRTGRQPLYHVAIEELQEWTYAGEPLVPLKGFPGVVWQRSKRKKRRDHDGLF